MRITKNITKKTVMLITFMGILIATNSFGDDSSGKDKGRRHHGPPPEAYTACEGKEAGDRAEFESPCGNAVTGTCIEVGDRLVLRPDNPPERGRRGRWRDSNEE